MNELSTAHESKVSELNGRITDTLSKLKSADESLAQANAEHTRKVNKLIQERAALMVVSKLLRSASSKQARLFRIWSNTVHLQTQEEVLQSNHLEELQHKAD